jgi:ribosomal protein S18 acetylase RimI-like enzyme
MLYPAELRAVQRLIEEAARAGQAVTLGVVKTNPALRLYQRLGFQITHDDDRKFYMRREPEPGFAHHTRRP